MSRVGPVTQVSPTAPPEDSPQAQVARAKEALANIQFQLGQSRFGLPECATEAQMMAKLQELRHAQDWASLVYADALRDIRHLETGKSLVVKKH